MAAIYTSYDAFLKQAIREYYDRSWKTRRGNFIALLIASGQVMGLAKDSVTSGEGTKKVAIGAGLAIALRYGLTFALGGPLSMVLGVAAGASIIAYFVRNQKDIVKKVGGYRDTIAANKKKYEEISAAGKHTEAERTLMIDGLMKQFIAHIDEA